MPISSLVISSCVNINFSSILKIRLSHLLLIYQMDIPLTWLSGHSLLLVLDVPLLVAIILDRCWFIRLSSSRAVMDDGFDRDKGDLLLAVIISVVVIFNVNAI